MKRRGKKEKKEAIPYKPMDYCVVCSCIDCRHRGISVKVFEIQIEVVRKFTFQFVH